MGDLSDPHRNMIKTHGQKISKEIEDLNNYND